MILKRRNLIRIFKFQSFSHVTYVFPITSSDINAHLYLITRNIIFDID